MKIVLQIRDFLCIDHFLKQRLQVVVFEMRDAWSGFDADVLLKQSV